MSLEDLEKELYAQKQTKREQSKIISAKSGAEEKDQSNQSPWGIPEKMETSARAIGGKISKYSRVVITVLIVIVVLLTGFAGFYLYQYFTTKDVAVDFSGPSEINVGIPFTLSVTFNNLSKRTLSSPKVSLSLPDGIIYVQDPQKRVITNDIDPIDSGVAIKEDYNVAIVGSSLKTYEFIGRVSYAYDANTFSSRFEKSKTYGILARDPVIALDLNTPDKVLNGQDFEVDLQYQNITDLPIDVARIQFKVPDSFHLNNSNPQLDNYSLDVSNLQSKTQNPVIFSGLVMGQESSFFNLEAHAQVQIGGQYYDINVKTASIAIEISPLAIQIQLEGQNQIINPGDKLTYNIAFSNNSDINLSDAVLSINLQSPMFDYSSVTSDGYFNYSDKSITWTAANLPILQEIKSRSQGNATVRVKLLSNFPISRLTDKDFIAKVVGQISSPTVPYNVTASKTIGMAVAENKIAGVLQVFQKAYHNEPSPDIVNGGSLPPTVGQSTEYTIHWDLAAFASDYNNVKITAFLGPGVSWTGKFSANTQTVPSYNDRTQQVTWDIGSVAANQGVIGSGPQAVFQISLTPSVNQVDLEPLLVSRINVSATDIFTENQINLTLSQIESKDLSDAFLPNKFDTVQQ
jgi:uncharacterized repeat protein (TIGR01451 family)